MLKAPIPGLCKTRLAHDLGGGGEAQRTAAEIYRQLVERQIAQIPAQWTCYVHYTPSNAEPQMREWLGLRHRYIAQPEGDLGERMCFAMRTCFASGAPGVLFLGGDCPELFSADLIEAAEHLARHDGGGADVVIAPATDGGYCILATRKNAPELFSGIAWSTSAVFKTTQQRCVHSGLSLRLLRPMTDVDDLKSLKAVAPELLPADFSPGGND